MCNKGIDILELIEDTVEVNAKTFGLMVLEKVAALGVDDETMSEFNELVSFWAEKMEEDVEYLLDLISGDNCDCDCCCDEEHEEHCDCDESCTCGCQEGKPCTCHEEKCECDCGCEHKEK